LQIERLEAVDDRHLDLVPRHDNEDHGCDPKKLAELRPSEHDAGDLRRDGDQ
jgi:hypothetical protein